MAVTEALTNQLVECAEKQDFEGAFKLVREHQVELSKSLTSVGVRDALKKTTKDRLLLSFLDGAGFGEKPFDKAMVSLEKLVGFQEGALVLSKAWGLGKVKRLDYFYKRITVDFKVKKGHQFTYAAAVDMLEGAPEGHILVLRETAPADFEALLKDKSQTAETKAYVRERIASARALREAIEKRRQTVKDIAQAVFDRQQDFFERGFGALKPLTELEVAASVGVHGTTVSRTVRDKYAETPYGTIELRRFFSTGVKTSAGETVSQEAVLGKLREIVDGEDKSNPLSDEKIAAELKGAGYPVARRTVAKYRDKLGIPGRNDRVIA